MGKDTEISWCDHTFNPVIGCTAISPACDHCYAETLVKRYGGDFSVRGRTSVANWKQPAKWDRAAAIAGSRSRVFCASLADVFDNQWEESWRADLFALIAATPNLDWLLLTKRPQNIAKLMPLPLAGEFWENVWLGTTAEDEHHYRQRWPHLVDVPAKLRFLSYEPALGPIGDLDLGRVGSPDWVIAGGESGRGARPAHPDWFRDVRDQCAAGGVGYHFKQWGEWAPGENSNGAQIRTEKGAWFDDGWRFQDISPRVSEEMHRDDEPDVWRIGKKAAGSLLDGVEHKAFPNSSIGFAKKGKHV